MASIMLVSRSRPCCVCPVDRLRPHSLLAVPRASLRARGCAALSCIFLVFGAAPVLAQPLVQPLPPPPAPRPSFQSMFTDRVNQPLASTVNTLWGMPSNGEAPPARTVQVLDLFTDTRPNERKLLGDKA